MFKQSNPKPCSMASISPLFNAHGSETQGNANA